MQALAEEFLAVGKRATAHESLRALDVPTPTLNEALRASKVAEGRLVVPAVRADLGRHR